MSACQIEISRTAEKQLKSQGKDDQRRIVAAILRLGSDPRPRGSRELSGYSDVFRIRVRHFRVIYSIEARRLLIIILKIGHRNVARRPSSVVRQA